MNNIGLAFKGGKESTIVLHKYVYLNPVVFTIMNDNLPEITNYFTEIEALYNIVILKFHSLSDAVDYLKIKKISTIITGCKQTDIGWYCEKLHQSMSPQYPNMVCFNPLISYNYQNTWDYIKQEKLPVCSLYHNGYTSISVKGSTYPNYFLFDKDHFDHAKKLESGLLEKQGIILNKLPVTYIGNLYKHIFNSKISMLYNGIYYGKINDEMVLVLIDNKIKIKYKNINNATLTITGFLRRGNKMNDKDKIILHYLSTHNV